MRIGTSTRSRTAAAASVHRLPAREQGQRPPAGRGDQRDQLVVRRRPRIAVACAGRACAWRSTAAPGARSRTGCRRRRRRSPSAGRPTRAASDDRDRRAGQHRRALVPDALAQRRADVERGDLEARVARRGPTRRRRSPSRCPSGQVEVLDGPAGEDLGPQLALLGVLDRRVDGGERRRRSVETHAGLDEQRPGPRPGSGIGQPLAGVRPERLAQHVGDVDDRRRRDVGSSMIRRSVPRHRR